MKKQVGQKGQKRVKRGKNENLSDSDFGGNYWKIFGISLFSRGNSQVLKILEEKLDLGTKKYWVATVNPEFVMMAEKDGRFKRILGETNLNVMDGIGLIWAQQMLRPNFQFSTRLPDGQVFNFKLLKAIKIGVEVLKGKYKNQVASGADLILELAKMAKEKNKKIFLLGGWGDRAEKTARYLSIKYQVSSIKYNAGEPEVDNEEVLKQINSFKPDILLVAYGMKKQEFWIEENLKNLDVGLVVGVGRSFDYYSGELKRAPEGLRKMGLEWFYSLVKEPERFKRQLVLPRFVWKVMRS